jgi:cobalt-zinc-cadmium efflux system outer membrane protein
MSSLLARAALAACVTIVAASGAAQVPAGGPPLTLANAVELTLERNPDLASFGFRLRAQQSRVDAAALGPPLQLRVDVEDAFGTGRTSGLDTAEATFTLAHVIELGDKREYRVAAADAGSNVIEVERAAAQLDVLAEVTRRFIHVAADEQHLQLTMTATELAQQTAAAAAERVAAARAPEVELRRANITLARAQIEREHAEHELLSSRRKLAAMWGDVEPTFSEVTADLYQLPAPDTFEALVAKTENNPDFARFASAARLRDAEIRLAEAGRRASIVVHAGIKQLQQSDDQAFVFGFAMPLGSERRARAAIAEATAERGQTDAELAAHRVNAQAQLFELYQELRHAITEADVLRASVLPEMQAALEATRIAFERGRYSYLEWVDAQRELVEVQRALIEAAANAHLYRAEIERLTGESLSVAN